MTVLGHWRQYLRCRQEASFNAATPQTAKEWNHGLGAAIGWIDLVDQLDGAGLAPVTNLIFPSGKSGQRFVNNASPIAGAQTVQLGQLTMPVYPELIDRFLRATFGSVTRTPTAGVAAQASTAFASLATLTTQPSTLEQLKFVIVSSTASSAAVINIIQNAVTVETITIGTSVASVDGTYYSKGGYDGSVNAITFTIGGTVTSGMVTVSGITKVASNHVFNTSGAPSLVIEQAASIQEGSTNSEFFPGCKVPTLSFAYDRRAVDNILLATATINGLLPTVATSTGFGGDFIAGSDAAYRPFAGWTGAMQIDDVADVEIISANLNINSNDEHYSTSSGLQAPTGAIEGLAEFFGTITIIPTATSRWDDYQAATGRKMELEFTTPHYITGTTGYQFKITCNSIYIESYTRAKEGAAQSAELTVRGVYNSTDAGPCQVDTISRLPV
jgi:hypothetical protein